MIRLNKAIFRNITASKVSNYGVISGPYFPNTRKYGPEITPYLDTFHAVCESLITTESAKEFFFRQS